MPTAARAAIQGRREPAPSCATRRERPWVKVSDYLGRATNNIAEYTAIIRGLEALAREVGADIGETIVDVRMDSELVVKQMQGVYKVKHPNLKAARRARAGAHARLRFRIVHECHREQNKDADGFS